MIRHRSDAQVLTSAEQIDALNARIERDVVQQLVAIRATWQHNGTLAGVVIPPTVAAAVHDPTVQAWDGVFTAAVRRTLRFPRPRRA